MTGSFEAKNVFPILSNGQSEKSNISTFAAEERREHNHVPGSHSHANPIVQLSGVTPEDLTTMITNPERTTKKKGSGMLIEKVRKDPKFCSKSGW